MDKKYWFFGSKLNTVLLLILIILMVIALRWMSQDRDKYLFQNKIVQDKSEEIEKDTYTYTSHGFSIELPKGFVPRDEKAEGGPYNIIILPDGNGVATYISDMNWWKKYDAQVYTYLGTETIAQNVFSIYKYNDTAYPESDNRSYLYQKGNVGYMFSVNDKNKTLLETFKFIGWSQVSNKMINGNNYGAKYSFEAPATWVESDTKYDGCPWKSIAKPNDGHFSKGEIGVYPTGCFNIDIVGANAEYTTKGNYYIVQYIPDDKDDAIETKSAYHQVIATFKEF